MPLVNFKSEMSAIIFDDMGEQNTAQPPNLPYNGNTFRLAFTHALGHAIEERCGLDHAG